MMVSSKCCFQNRHLYRFTSCSADATHSRMLGKKATL
jgi:hypothetical protein